MTKQRVKAKQKARTAKQKGTAARLQELSRVAGGLQWQLSQAESQQRCLAEHEQILQHIVSNKSGYLFLLSTRAPPEGPAVTPSSISETPGTFQLEEAARYPAFSEELVLQAKSRTWHDWNVLHRSSCQRLALLLARLESPAAEASPAAAQLEQAVKEYDFEIALLHTHCQEAYRQCVARHCDTGDITPPPAVHWQHVVQRVQFNQKQRRMLATSITTYLKAQQPLLQQQMILQQELKELCTRGLLGAFGYAEVEACLDQITNNIKQMFQPEASIASLLWTSVCSVQQKARLVVASYPYWPYPAASKWLILEPIAGKQQPEIF
jgi:hypothetical protein